MCSIIVYWDSQYTPFKRMVCKFQVEYWNNEVLIKVYIRLKGTVNVISSDPPCKEGNARFTMFPLKALSD